MDTSIFSEAIERAAKESGFAILPKLRQVIIDQMESELRPVLEMIPPSGAETTDLLRQAIVGLQESTSQTDILTALLDGAERFSGRCGLLIVRGGLVVGWQSHGLDAEMFKRVQVDCARGVVERAIQGRSMAMGTVEEFDPSMATRLGAPSDGNCVVLPLSIRDRVAAVLYADCGDRDASALDISALDILIRITSLWLEVLVARQAPVPAPQPVAAAQAAHAAAAPQAAPPPVAAPEPAKQTVAPPAPKPEPAGAAPAPVVDDELRNKARRFAKLLVEEIKLYNQAKVVDGRANRDLYSRLREDIEKSKAAYRKRFGQYITDADYFTSELVRILADNDRTLLGSNYPD